MVTEKEISSTEKLLDVIRKGTDPTGSDPPPGGEPPNSPRPSGIRPGKKKLPFGAKAVVGVELLEDGLRAVKMTKTGGGWRAEQVVTAAIRTQASLDSPEFVSFLRQSLQRVEGIKNARLWTMISTDRGEIWQVNVPQVKKDVHNAVFWTAKREKSFDENTTAFDFRILGETTESGAKKLAVEVFTAPQEDVDLLRKVFARAGFPLEGITLFSFAIQNLFAGRRVDPGADAFAVLCIGRESSAIDMHHHDRILLSRTIKTGLESMVEAFLEAHGAGDDTGSEPRGHGAASPPPGRKRALELISRLEAGKSAEAGSRSEDLFDMISPALERLARQVERTIDHSFNVLGHPAPTRLYLSGRLASAPGIAEFFQDQLGLTTIVLDPLDPAMPHGSPNITSLNVSDRVLLAPAAGLAISARGVTPNFLYTNQDRETQKIAKRNGALMGTGLLAAALITGVFLFQAQRDLAQIRRQTKDLQQRIDAQSPQLTSAQMNRLAADYLERTTRLRQYAQKFVPVAVLSELSAITPPHIRLLNLRMETGQHDTRQARFLVVDGFIKGEGINFETHLSSYLFRIRNSPLFADTTIQTSNTVNFESEGQVLRFVININLKQVAHERT